MSNIELIGIADKINEINTLIHQDLKSALEYGIECGRLLSKVKIACGHGNFIKWINKNCEFSDKTAESYMKIYIHKDKIETVSNLQSAYKIISNIEHSEKLEIEHQRKEKYTEYKKTGVKPDDWTRSDDYYVKRDKENSDRDERIKQAKTKIDNNVSYANEHVEEHEKYDFTESEKLIKQVRENQSEQAKFVKQITDGNKYQDTFFLVIDNYINELKSDTEKIEAVQNIIKYCKRISIKYQQNKIKGGE